MAGVISQLYPDVGNADASKIQGEDVSGAEPADGDVLVYDSTLKKYVPKIPGAGAEVDPDFTSWLASTPPATAAQGAKADSALQPTGNGSGLTGITPAQIGAADFIDILMFS